MSLVKVNSNILNTVNISELNGQTLPQTFEGNSDAFNLYGNDLEFRGRDIVSIHQPIAELNNHTLREVFEDTSLFDSLQLLTNGDFSNGTTGWTSVSSTNTMSNGNIINTGDGTNISARLYQLYLFNNTQKYYASVKFRIINKQSTQVLLRGDVDVYQTIQNPIIGEWYKFNTIIENTNDSTFTIRPYYASSEIQNGSQLEVNYAYMFNISTLITNKQYSPLYNTTFDLMTDEQIKIQMDMFVQKPHLFLDYTDFGISYLTVEQMDNWYNLYQTLKDSEIKVVSGKKRIRSYDTETPSLNQPIEELNNHTLRDVFQNRNMAKPYLTGKTDLGGGNYRIYAADGITIDYNVNSSIYKINGTATTVVGVKLSDFMNLSGEYIGQYIYISGSTTTRGINYFVQTQGSPSTQIPIISTANYTDKVSPPTYINNICDIRVAVFVETYTDFQFKLQLEKGTQATPYQVPTDGTYNNIDVGALGLTSQQMDYWFNIYKTLKDNGDIINYEDMIIDAPDLLGYDDRVYYDNGKYYMTKSNTKLYDIETPISQLNNQTLREVFEGGNLFNPTALARITLVDGIYVSQTDNQTAYLVQSIEFNQNDKIYMTSNIIDVSADNFSFAFYDFRTPAQTQSFYIDSPQRISHVFTLNSDKTQLFYGYPNQLRTGSISFNNNYTINLTSLGISYLTVEQMDYWFNVYKTLKDTTQPFVVIPIVPETIEINATGKVLKKPNITITIDDLDENDEIDNSIMGEFNILSLYLEQADRINYIKNSDKPVGVDINDVYRNYETGQVIDLGKLVSENKLSSPSWTLFKGYFYEPYEDYYISLSKYNQTRLEMKNWYSIYTESLAGFVGLKDPSTYDATVTTLVDGGRNTVGYFIGDIIRDNMGKVEMTWKVLSGTEWSNMLILFDKNSGGKFVNSVTFLDQVSNNYVTRDMYVSDRKAGMLFKDGNRVYYSNPSFSLVEV